MFEVNFNPSYRHAKADLAINPLGIMEYMQDASVLHTESTDYKMDYFQGEQKAFILTNWQVEFFTAPKYGDTITIKTYPCYFKGILCLRAFETFAGDKRVATALSRWVYSDFAKRRLIRPPDFVTDSYGSWGKPPIEEDFSMPDSTDAPFDERIIVPQRSDTDTNSHVNNLVYIKWAIDALPDNVYDSMTLKSLKVVYKKECLRGDKLLLKTSKTSDGKFLSCLENPQEGALCALIYTQWDDKTKDKTQDLGGSAP